MVEGLGYGGAPDADQRRCFDCRHCKAAVSWWCTNADAVAARGTKIPDASGCANWEPMRTAPLTWRERWFGGVDYLPINLASNKAAPC